MTQENHRLSNFLLINLGRPWKSSPESCPPADPKTLTRCQHFIQSQTNLVKMSTLHSLHSPSSRWRKNKRRFSCFLQTHSQFSWAARLKPEIKVTGIHMDINKSGILSPLSRSLSLLLVKKVSLMKWFSMLGLLFKSSRVWQLHFI